jgi:fibro-slime domain-containing protein
MKLSYAFGAALLLAVAAPMAGARAQSMSATYFTISGSDPDMGTLASGAFNNEVQSALGTDGLPVLNTTTYGCTSNCFDANTPLPTDLTGSGEITWWSPSLNSNVTQTGTGTITLPYNNTSFYPPNGGGPNDANGFQAALFSSTLNVGSTEAISFNVGADDTAFVYLDGQNVCDLGGVHGDSPGACTSAVINPGAHTLDLFYADIHQTGADLTFGITTQDVTSTPNVPEPASLVLLGVGLAGLGIVRRRRA